MWTLIRLISCTLLLGSSSSVERRPHTAHEETPDVTSRRALLVEAVKMGILSSLGMDGVPELTHKASKQELRRMYQLYRERLRDMRGNSSRPTGDTWQTATSQSVLVPAAVKVLRRGGNPQPRQHMRWHRVVFHKNPDIQAEVTLARAELKVSRQILNKPTSAQPALGRDVLVNGNVRVNVKPPTPAARPNTHALIHANVSNTQDVRVDIRPKVEQWMRNGAGGSLVVDVGTAVDEREALGTHLDFSLELNFIQPKPTRTRFPRSDKEDDCSDQGWCCRKSVTVSFKDIGWSDWVVAPTEYTMHLCDGTCPHNYKPASMHTQVKSRLYQLMKGRTPRPCCVPASYEPMVLMHYDSRGKLMLTPFDDLIVSKCHCA